MQVSFSALKKNEYDNSITHTQTPVKTRDNINSNKYIQRYITVISRYWAIIHVIEAVAKFVLSLCTRYD